MVEPVPWVILAVSMVLFTAYYVWIMMRVPPKRSLSFKGRLALYLATSKVGTFNDVLMAIISVGSCILFVWETYMNGATPIWMFCTELFFSTGFAYQYFLSLYTTHNIPMFLISLQAVVDVVTVVPVFITLITAQYQFAAEVGFLRVSRIMKFTRVLRLLRLFRSVNVISSATDNAIRHQIILLMTTITSILVVTTGFVQFMGNEVEAGLWNDNAGLVHFHDALYFTVVTFATVGYGDMSPGGWMGRLVMLSLIAITFVLVPFETSKLVRLTRLRSAYSGYLSLADGNAHIIVACDVECAGVADFLKEFFHEDHGAQSTRVCLLAPGEPTMSTKELLLHHKRVTFLKGDAMAGEDLARARADRAVGCFILTNRFTENTDEQDSITVLRALNVKSYNRSLNTFVQIIEPENVVHVLSAGVTRQNVLCINSAKLGLLGQSCVFPGFSTLITNLVVSVAYSSASLKQPWHQEYSAGLLQEIYSLPLPREYEGRTFAEVALFVYRRYDSTMFAVGVPAEGGEEEGGEEGGMRVLLNPGCQYILRPGTIAFLITEDQHSIDTILSHAGRDVKEGLSAPTAVVSRRASRLLSITRLEEGKEGADSGTPSGLRRRVKSPTARSQEARAGTETSSKRPSPLAIPAVDLLPTTPQEAHPVYVAQPRENYRHFRVRRSGVGAAPDTISEGSRDSPSPVLDPTKLSVPGSMLSPKGQSLQAPTASERELEAAVATGMRPVNANFMDIHMGGASGPAFIQQRKPKTQSIDSHDADPAERAHKVRQLARASLIQNLTEIIDNMHGTVQEEFLEDLGAVLSTMVLDPEEQVGKEVTFVADEPLEQAVTDIPEVRRRRSSFVGRSLVKQPSLKRRQLAQAVRASLAAHDGSTGVHDHIVVVCSTADDLQYLIAPLRSTFLERQPAVVVLCPVPPDERIWADLSSYDDVYFVEGVPHMRDLRRAGVASAECVVILARNTRPVSSTHFSSQDAEVVLTVLDLQAGVEGDIRSLAELNCSRYMKHIGPGRRTGRGLPTLGDLSDDMEVVTDDSYIFESSYTSGKVLPANFLESLLCQAFFNPHIVSLVTAMVSGCPMGQTRQDRLRSSSTNIAMALDRASEPVQGKTCAVKSHTMQIKVPPQFCGKSYGDLFQHLLMQYDMLPVGLYRYGEDLGNPSPFVFTSPPAQTQLAERDLVFVFVPCMAGDACEHGSGVAAGGSGGGGTGAGAGAGAGAAQ